MGNTNNTVKSGDVDELKDSAKKNATISHKLVIKAKEINKKAGELVTSAKENEAQDKNSAILAGNLQNKTDQLDKATDSIVDRELKMVEQKEEIAQLKKTQ